MLHMLRRDLGDTLFRECVRIFYREFEFGNALSGDFQRVVDSLSAKDHSAFFRQWLFTPGHPVLSAEWHPSGSGVQFTLKQQQEGGVFEFPLDIRLELENGTSIDLTLQISAREENFTFPTESRPARVILDPDCWLLFETL